MRLWVRLQPDALRRKDVRLKPDPQAFRRKQEGWIGLVALLIALAIVAWLAMSALKGYGVAPKPASGAPPTDPRERARAVEQTVIDKARETARQIEEGEKQ
ncbi:MAG TPA: hypothetical protein VII68_03185 [Casimicrobiaceae bacterium]|jgi:hypothetical protein